jgi:hypothetical protein
VQGVEMRNRCHYQPQKSQSWAFNPTKRCWNADLQRLSQGTGDGFLPIRLHQTTLRAIVPAHKVAR